MSRPGVGVQQLSNNSSRPPAASRRSNLHEIQPDRRTADIEASELDSDTLAPGDTVRRLSRLRHSSASKQRIALELKLPSRFAGGNYTALIGDELNNVAWSWREHPHWGAAES